MDLTIHSYQGVGNLRFGMTVNQIRQIVETDVKAYMKTPMSVFPTDYFKQFHLHVFYKKSGVCEAIEVFNPSQPSFFGKEFNNRPFSEVSSWFEDMDDSVELLDTGLVSLKYGISIYARAASDYPEKPVEAVLVFAKGYWK